MPKHVLKLCIFSLGFFGLRKRFIAVVALEEHGIDEDGRTNNDTLLVHSGIVREMQFKCICVGEHLRRNTLGFLDNLANVVGTVRVFKRCGKDVKWNLATSTSTARIAFGATVDQAAATASGLLNFVDLVSVVVCHGESRNAAIILFDVLARSNKSDPLSVLS